VKKTHLELKIKHVVYLVGVVSKARWSLTKLSVNNIPNKYSRYR